MILKMPPFGWHFFLIANQFLILYQNLTTASQSALYPDEGVLECLQINLQ